MKYNYKLVFTNNQQLFKFTSQLFNYVSKRKDWIKYCDWTQKSNRILYVQTANYCCIDNYIKSRQCDYNYTITKL